jgi:hypothetical protein
MIKSRRMSLARHGEGIEERNVYKMLFGWKAEMEGFIRKTQM